MKKKGLIISTVVMVVVLIASLTTATYAWFTVSNKTTISGFNLSVVAGNAVNIGVKKDNDHKVGAINDDFLSGDVTWTNSTSTGQIGKDAGGWSSGTVGLSPTLTHNINWGEQSKAVGAFNAATYSEESDSTKYGYIGDAKDASSKTGKGNTAVTSGENKTYTFLNAANLGEGNKLTAITPAYANKGKDEGTKGDYAYLFLGAAPAEQLTSNTLVLVLDGSASTGTNVGMLAAVHVAYRVTLAGAKNVTTEWTEAEFFTCRYNAALKDQTYNWSPTEKKAYETAYSTTSSNVSAPDKNIGVVKIGGLSTAQGAIDQIELIIYIAGSDPDCIDNAKNASGEIKMFFATESATKTDALTAATYSVDSNNGTTFELTGYKAGATLEYRVGESGEWTKITETVSNNSVTVATLKTIAEGSKVYIRQTEAGKAASPELEAKVK